MGHVGAAKRSVYCASKHAMEGFTKSMAIELGPRQNRVNTICPTFIETPMTAPFLADASFRAETLAKIKLGHFGRIEDIMGRHRIPRLRRFHDDHRRRHQGRRRLDGGVGASLPSHYR